MKRCLPLILLAVLTQTLNAQSYFPEGATWTYLQGAGGTSSVTTLTKIESRGDSIFNGETLTYLEGSVACAVGFNEFVKQIDQEIYKLNKCDSTFSLLYDFGAAVGDTIVIPVDPCEYENQNISLRVDSIVPFDVNGALLDKFYISQLDFVGFEWEDNVIEGLGNLSSFYPLIGFCDPQGGPLRCYQDNILGEYIASPLPSFLQGDCDTVFLSINELPKHEMTLYPNPTKGALVVNFGEVKQDVEICLMDRFGQIISTRKHSKAELIHINIEGAAGLYFLRVASKPGESISFKVLKE
ncbi:MAG: T9SS type A sorting domain-containing protein [Flavobacteriales bacterium]|nr:T9SS type A sorting domain-containing protein [Flavobacteriales bacterium]